MKPNDATQDDVHERLPVGARFRCWDGFDIGELIYVGLLTGSNILHLTVQLDECPEKSGLMRPEIKEAQ